MPIDRVYAAHQVNNKLRGYLFLDACIEPREMIIFNSILFTFMWSSLFDLIGLSETDCWVGSVHANPPLKLLNYRIVDNFLNFNIRPHKLFSKKVGKALLHLMMHTTIL